MLQTVQEDIDSMLNHNYYAPRTPTFYISGSGNDAIRKMFGARGYKRVFKVVDADFVVFPGGADINPLLYGEPVRKGTGMSLTQDREDIDTLRSCLASDKQVKIGICRGAQFLNVMVGNGRLYQHVNNHGTAHEAIEIDTKRRFNVSSTHHQMMIPGPTGKVLLGAEAVARERCTYDSKFIVPPGSPFIDPEAVLYLEENTFCFQPHPEHELPRYHECTQFFFDTISCYFLSKVQEDALKENLKSRKKGSK